MRQTFTAKTDPKTGALRARALRDRLAARGVDGFLVPRADEHQGEWVAPRSERLAWLTSFTGSAGLAIVLTERAAVFVDGRYTVQVRQQVDTEVFEPVSTVETQPEDWLRDAVGQGARIGFDPWLHTPAGIARFRKALERAGATLVALEPNPIDEIWEDQPEPPTALAVPYNIAHAGQAATDKRADLGAGLARDGAKAAVLTLPDSIAWLLNIRGGDVSHSPIALAFAILHDDGHTELFIDERKVDDALRTHLGNGVTIRAPEELGAALDALGTDKARVLVDPNWAPLWIAKRLEGAGATLVNGPDPCLLPKACKNAVEVQGARTAHARDGAAMTRFLCWLTAQAPTGTLDEIAVVRKLEEIREQTGALKDISFESISGAGPNGALPHYRVSEASNTPLETGTLYLIDSGGQYLEGTTDITRTIAVGEPTQEMRDRFTRVLKGMIALSCARFPAGTRGIQLDTLARLPLWQGGFDYDHGTGHGVGSYLGVHEGPQSISKMLRDQDLKPGMIVSNEPGYYKEGHYGIRTENLIVVTDPEMPPGGDRPMMGFETLTLAPIDRTLIDITLMSADEIAWLNAYHARVRAEIGPQVDANTRAWLEEATAPLGA